MKVRWLVSMAVFSTLSISSLSAMADNTDVALRNLINTNGLTGDPSTGRTIPDIRSSKAQLGMRLFFNKSLGGLKDMACVSCHHPLLGGGDDLSLSIGVQATVPDLLGPGRRHINGSPTVPRNAPSTFNMGLWDSHVFWDGRVSAISPVDKANGSIGGLSTPTFGLGVKDPLAGDNLVAAQAKFPVTSVAEMRGSFEANQSTTVVWNHLIGRLGNFGTGKNELARSDYWLNQFRNVYGTATSKPEAVITEHNVFDAIGAYERSQVFVNNPWRAYVKGNNAAISDSAKRGALLFYRPYEQGGASCVTCHAGDKFTNEQFYNIAMPQIGKGTRGGNDNTNDYGLGFLTGLTKDRYKFRTPSLLNVEGTGPYSHAGAYLNLTDVIKHHLNPTIAIATYNSSKVEQLNPGIEVNKMLKHTNYALVKLWADQRVGRTPLRNIALTDSQVKDIEAFLKTLTDPCIKSASCLAPWIPPVKEDPNGLQLDARFDTSARVK